MSRGMTRSSINRVVVSEQQTARSNPQIQQTPQTPQTQQPPQDEKKHATEEISDNMVSFERILFVSNKKLSKDITKKFPSIVGFDKQHFINRNCAQMVEFGLNYIWLDVSNKYAMTWFCENLKTNHSYTVIVAYDYVNRAMKTSKFITDLENLEDGIHLFIKYKDLIGIKSINMNDLTEKIKNYTKVHNPVSCWESILGFSPNLSKKRL